MSDTRRLPEQLQGRAVGLTLPATLANFFVALLSVFYASLTFGFSDSDLGRFLIVGMLSIGAVAMGAEIRGQRQLKILRGLASGDLLPRPDSVIAAIVEVRALPDFLSMMGMIAWAIAVSVVAIGMRWWVGVPWSMVFRLLGLGLMFGPLASVLSYLLVTRRSRLVAQQLASALPVNTVLEALAAKRGKVRSRLVIFTVIVVVLPSLMMIDVTRKQSGDVFARVAAAPRENRRAVAAQAMSDAGWRTAFLASLVLLLAIAAAYEAGSLLAEPMRRVADEANRIANGELREARVIAAEDEVWAMTSTFSLLHAQLVEIIAQLQKAGISIGSTTEQLMATSSSYENGAADQASSLNETSATTEELAQSARQISHNAGNVADIAQKTLEAAREGQASAEAFATAVDRMKQDNRAISEAVLRLQKRVQQIGKIVEFITGVADRSDLLALSAELEGTKAGEVGRGFTLVAAEMRRLAENVIESTNEIEELISEIREATQVTVEATGQGLEQTESGTALAGSVTHALASVVELAQRTSDSVRGISLATQQQQTSTDQLAEAMADILGITQQSLAATKQVTSANHELIALSTDLKAIVEKFRVQI